MSALSVTLCVAMLLPYSTEAFAESGGTGEPTVGFEEQLGEPENESSILTELSEKRTETSKTFYLDDGNLMIADYNMPVHFKDDKGQWTDYDNTLVVSNDEATPDEPGDADYETKNSPVKIKLSNKSKKNNMVKVSSDDYSVSWGYEGAAKKSAEFVKSDTELKGNDVFTTLTKLVSETIYKDVFPNVDLQYFVSSTGIKENIILKSAEASTEFNINYKVADLSANLTDEHTISLYDKDNKEVYSIAAPYMTDADGNVSEQLTLSIVEQKGSKIKIKLTADTDFVHSAKYPVVIDPELTINAGGNKLMFNEAYTGGYLINHGPYYLSNNGNLICKANTLQSMADGEMVVSAKFNFSAENYGTLFASENDDPIIINAHKMTRYTNGVQYSQDILDYDSLSYSDNRYFSFDLTKLYKDWYNNGDAVDGFVLEALNTIGNKQIDISTSSPTPTFTLIYKDFTGTENWLSYHSFAAGNNATVSVSDYLGNAVISQPLYEGTGARMPLSLYATYNSINRGTAFENGSQSGCGWQFSFNQYVRDATNALKNKGYHYIYRDADGTDHYLKKADDANEWYDEEGLGLKLTVGENNITVENGNTQTYALTSAGGRLLSEEDEHGNTVTYSYNNGDISSITDGAGRTVSFSYSNGKVSALSLPGNLQVSVNYTQDGNYISSFEFPGNTLSAFEYDNSNRICAVKKASNSSGYTNGTKLGFAYNSSDQVVCIAEYGSDNTQGNSLTITYGTDNTTVFTDNCNRSETCTFDNEGNRISVLNANGYLQSEAGSGLLVSGGAESFTKNYITESTEQSAVQSSNYFFAVNGDRNGVTSSGGTATTVSNNSNETVAFFGSTAIRINNPVSNNNAAFFTGAAHQFGNSFNGKAVTFSAYVKTEDITQIYETGAIGATLKIKCFDANNAKLLEVNSVGITGSEQWQRLSISAQIPSDTDHFRVYCMIRYASGTAWFDCFQLEEGNCANDFNALQDADFSANNNHWYDNNNTAVTPVDGTVTLTGAARVYNNAPVEDATEETTEPEEQYETQVVTEYETSPNDSVVTYDAYGNAISNGQGFVNRLVKKTYIVDQDNTVEPTEDPNATVSSEPEDEGSEEEVLTDNYIFQNVNVDRAGVIFNLVGEAQAKSVPLTNENRTFGIALKIYYDGGATEQHYQEFNSNTDKKQTTNLVVYPNNLETVIDSVDFAFVYGYNENTMIIYNAMLNIAESGYSSGVDEPEPETTVPDSTEPSNAAEDYDDYIDYEVLSEEIDTSQPYMLTSTDYDNAGNYVMSETDEAGNTVTYTRDSNGNITSITDGEGNETEYTYNATGSVTSITNGDAQNTYHYNELGNLSSIDHNGFSYVFNYDIYDREVSDAIGNVVLKSNEYDSNGLLIQTSFANHNTITYQYDEYDRVCSISNQDNCISFIYNKKGLVAKETCVLYGFVQRDTYFYYDFNGTKIGEYRQGANGELNFYLSYDENGNRVEKTLIDGMVKTIVRGNEEDSQYIVNDGITVSSLSDGFGRVNKILTIRPESQDVFMSDYEYADGSETNSTTKSVSALTQKYAGNQLVKYQYQYDGNGNITQISENGQVVAQYTYDELNQLVWSADRNTNMYTRMYYDDAGNITKVADYTLYPQTFAPASLIEERVYSYTDNNWKDKMTVFDGQTITYDKNGNPKTYRDGMSFTWIGGRQLKSVTKNNSTIYMSYDSNGMRIRKGNTYYFYDSNNNLTALTDGTNTLMFYYDVNGNPTAVKKATLCITT